MLTCWGRNVLLAIAALVPAVGCRPGHADTGGVALKDLPRMGPKTYRVDSYLKAAAQLQALEMDRAVAALSTLAAESDTIPDEGKVFALCRMLFIARPGREFRHPRFGRTVFLSQTDYADWPLNPIEIIDDVPFCVLWGYEVLGAPESASEYLRYCIRECDWSTRVYGPKTNLEKQEALTKLLASPKWKNGLDARDRAYLTAQIN
jgi:hypothetical protein